jgi:RNA polymerase sigma factor (sigma-70 family)
MATGQLGSVFQSFRRAALRQDGCGMTDGQLLECFLADREEAAFEALVRRHGAMVLGVCRRILRNSHDAEDAFQATFLVLVRKATSLGRRETIGNWLYGVAYHTALKARATAGKRRAKEAQARDMPTRIEVGKDLQSELLLLLDQELKRLSDKYREVVVLCELEGKTRKEAASQLGIPEGTLSGRLTTARRILAKRLCRHRLAFSAGLSTALPNDASPSVPAPLVVATVRSAVLFVAGKAAADLISANAAALAEGVLKTMLLTKLKTLAAVLVVLSVAGAGLGVLAQRQLFGQKPDAIKQNSPKASLTKRAEPRQEKPPEFADIYALPEGEVLKRVSPPFSPTRMDYYRREHAGQARAIPDGPQTMYFRWRDEKLKNWGMSFGSEDGTSWPTLLRILVDVYREEIEGDQEFIKKPITGDFIVREGVPADKVIPRLQEILQRECKLPIKLSFREVERKVIVARGKYHFSPLPGRQENQIDIYGKQLVQNSGAGGGSGDFEEFLKWVGMFIGRRVVSDVQKPPTGTLSWYNHRRSSFTEQEGKEDTDPETVLKHLTEQTGLTFKEENRRVRVLFVERANEPEATERNKVKHEKQD